MNWRAGLQGLGAAMQTFGGGVAQQSLEREKMTREEEHRMYMRRISEAQVTLTNKQLELNQQTAKFEQAFAGRKLTSDEKIAADSLDYQYARDRVKAELEYSTASMHLMIASERNVNAKEIAELTAAAAKHTAGLKAIWDAMTVGMELDGYMIKGLMDLAGDAKTDPEKSHEIMQNLVSYIEEKQEQYLGNVRREINSGSNNESGTESQTSELYNFPPDGTGGWQTLSGIVDSATKPKEKAPQEGNWFLPKSGNPRHAAWNALQLDLGNTRTEIAGIVSNALGDKNIFSEAALRPGAANVGESSFRTTLHQHASEFTDKLLAPSTEENAFKDNVITRLVETAAKYNRIIKRMADHKSQGTSKVGTGSRTAPIQPAIQLPESLMNAYRKLNPGTNKANEQARNDLLQQ